MSSLGSLLVVGLMIGTASGGALSEIISMKQCNMVTSPVIAVGWFLIATASPRQIYFIYLGFSYCALRLFCAYTYNRKK